MFPSRAILSRLWHYFSFDGLSPRGEYARVGFFSMFLKYAIDFAIIYLATKKVWTPLDYLSPLLNSKKDLPSPIQLYLITMMLPCVWLGLAMSAKRVRDAGLSMIWTLSFLLPIFNYIFMLMFCFLPSRQGVKPEESGRGATLSKVILDPKFWVTVVGAALLGCLCLVFATHIGTYGNNLFLVSPFLMGLLHGFSFGRSPNFNRKGLVAGAFAVWVVSMSFFLLFALEGIICLAMIAPLVIPVILFASLVGAELARKTSVSAVHLAPTLLFSLAFGFGETMRLLPEPKKVSTSVVIAAPIEKVWENVIGFPELPDPPALVKASGIAYPIRARIEGSGVGAIRYCEFSTGPFVEPITSWDFPTRLAFDVSDSPQPMQEWNPFYSIHPPHLDGYFQSKKGEFLLESLESGKTRVTGSTWYSLDIHPLPYWNIWAEFIVHAIHGRVLGHVKALSEG